MVPSLIKSKDFLLSFVVIIVLVKAGYAYYKWMPSPAEKEEKEEGEIIPPAATGNIDDLVDALEKEIQDELNVVYEGDEDGDLIISDTEEVNDFGRSAEDSSL